MNQMTGVWLFLRHLRTTGVIDTPPVDHADRPALLAAFRRWMREQRGTIDVTLDNYDISIPTLLEHLCDPPEQMNARRLRHCVLKYQ